MNFTKIFQILLLTSYAYLSLLQSVTKVPYMFGSNMNGQLGLTNFRVPNLLMSNVSSVCAGTTQIVFATKDNNIWSFGSGAQSALGISTSTTTSYYYTPQLLGPAQNPVQSLSCGYQQTVIYEGPNSIEGFGSVIALGAGTTNLSSTITFATMSPATALEGNGVSNVFAVGSSTFVLTSTGNLSVVGTNSYGQLGSNAIGASFYNLTSIPGVPNAQSVAGYTTMSVILDTSGNVWVAGSNFNGELGLNTTSSTFQSTFVQIPTIPSVTMIASNYLSSFALTSGGSLLAWGQNANGQLALPIPTTSSSYIITPTVVSVPVSVGTISQISPGASFTLFVNSNGGLFCVGDNTYGECGVPGFTTFLSTITSVPMPLPVTAIATAETSTTTGPSSYALLSDGSLYSWGASVGTGINPTVANPTLLTFNPSIIPKLDTFFLGYSVTMAYDSNNMSSLYGWGRNTEDELLTVDLINRSSPTLINTTGIIISDVAFGGNSPTTFFTIMIQNGTLGKLYGYGNNLQGQLTSSSASIITPLKYSSLTALPGCLNFTSVYELSLGIQFTIAQVLTDIPNIGLTVGFAPWGSNSKGQLGIPGEANNGIPFATVGNVLAIAGGTDHSCYLLDDGYGSLYVMGSNSAGQLGLGQGIQTMGQAYSNNYTQGNFANLRIWAGSTSTFIWTSLGLFVTGDNTQGALGLNSTQVYYAFTYHTFPQFQSEGILSISSSGHGGQFTLFLTNQGIVYGSGQNNKGQLGVGFYSDFVVYPTPAQPINLTASYNGLGVVAGYDHSVILYGFRTCPNDCKGSGADLRGTCDTVLGVCDCFEGFLGADCGYYQCIDPTCSGHGTCDIVQGLCDCDSGYDGSNCNFVICPNYCSGRGVCDRSTGVCQCEPGYGGVDCANNAATMKISFVLLFAVIISLLLL